MLAGLDEPVRRYFSHAISDGAALPNGVRIAMTGRRADGRRAILHVARPRRARAADAAARHRPLRRRRRQHGGPPARSGDPVHAHDANTARSAATRAAIESVVFAPPSVLADRGVAWRAETDNVIVARFDLPPARPEVRVGIDEHGAIRTVAAQRWGNAGEKTFQYIPFGGDVHAERRFGDLVLPSTLSVGWWFDTPRYAPFFHAEISAVTPTL
jgi:hypothetical protein